MKILIADDHQPTLRMLSARLKSWSLQPVLASTGEEAWEKLVSEKLNLVISDWEMPRGDGLDLCRRIRAANFEGYVYVILCTGKGDKSDLIAGLEAGADDFLSKPVDFDELRVALRSGTRVLELEARLNRKNEELSTANARLTEAYATIQQDLEAAAAMQTELLPRNRVALRGLEVDWLFMPASYLAGDIFDFFRLDDARLAFYHLDVAGHGVPAALLSVSINRALLNAHREGLLVRNDGHQAVPPNEIVGRLNEQFQGIGDSYFTMIYGVIDREASLVRLCQAGHPNPLVVDARGSVSSFSSGGFPVGMIAPMQYDAADISLQASSRLFVYSDGITECRNLEGEPFGEDRLLACLTRDSGLSLSDTIALLKQELATWRGNLAYEDDVSLLAFEVSAL